MSPDFDPWSLLKNAWVAIAALAGFIFKRHIDEDKERADALAIVQQSYATRADVAALHEKIDTNHRQLIDLLSSRR